MRRLPVLLSAVFLAITLARVAAFSGQYMRASALGWLFAVGLGVAVFATSYWTRTQTTRYAALCGLAFFVCVDALFNFADVWLNADTSTPLVAACAVVYGLFPTVAVALLGWLASRIASLPPLRTKSASLAERFVDWVAHLIPDAQPEAQETQVVVQPAQSDLFVCVACARGFTSQQGLAAHTRKHLAIKRNGHKEPTA